MRCRIAGPIVAVLLLGLLLAGLRLRRAKVIEVVVTATPKPHATATAPVATSTPAPAPTDTPAPVATATEEAIAPTSSPVEATECAAGVTAEVRDIDSRVEWAAYCATFLPPGYAKELIGGPNPLEIRIVNATTGARFYFVQGVNMNLSTVTSLVRNEGELVGPVSYGDLEAQLYHSLPGAEHGPFVAVMASGGEEGVIQYIEAYGPSEEEITAVAASMRRLDTLSPVRRAARRRAARVWVGGEMREGDMRGR